MKKTFFAIIVILLVLFIFGCTKADLADSTDTMTISETKDTDMIESETPDVTETVAPETEKKDETMKEEQTTKAETSPASPNEQLVIYPEFPDKINRIYDYDVSVTMGSRTEKLPVYNHTEESNISRGSGVDMYRRFSCFAFDGAGVRVDIKVKRDFTSYTVFPSAKNFKHEFKDGVISVFLDKPDYFGIRLDNDQNTVLSVISDLPETDVPSKNDPNVVWIDGWYEPDGTVLYVKKPNTTVYIAPGAVLDGRIQIEASGCKVIGRGAIVDPYENIYKYDIRDGQTEWYGVHPIEITNKVNSFKGDGFFVLDARKFNVRVAGKGTELTHVKLFSSLMTSDGFSMQSADSTVEHCFCYVGDNALVIGKNKNVVFRDITVGTTCAALFPERVGDNVLFEDINVFRSDGGILNHQCNNKNEQEIRNVVLKRLSAVDMPEKNLHFFLGRDMGTLSKLFTCEEISLPDFSEILVFENGASYIKTDNYAFELKNFAVGGEVITKQAQLKVNNSGNMKYTVNITSTSDFVPVKTNRKTVNYKAENKIYIGQRQVFLTNVKTEGGKLMMPTAEICGLLRADRISDAEYVSSDELKAKNAVSGVNTEGDTLYLVPVYNGENLLLPDEGEISRYAEQTCYVVDLVTESDTGKTVYSVYDFVSYKSSLNAGMSRLITDEVRMYGAGTYRLSFCARASENGTIRACVGSGTKDTEFNANVGTDWKEFSFDISIGQEKLNAAKCVIRFMWKGKQMKYFSLCDIKLTKVN